MRGKEGGEGRGKHPHPQEYLLVKKRILSSTVFHAYILEKKKVSKFSNIFGAHTFFFFEKVWISLIVSDR